MPKVNRAGKGTVLQETPKDARGRADELRRERFFASFMEGLLLGSFAAPTSIEEIAKYFPALWKQAVRAFGGDEAAARDWLDNPSALLGGEPPLNAALRAGGARKVLRALAQAERTGRRRGL
jgi:hypothetical protein